MKQNRQQSAQWRGKDSEHVRANRPMKGPTGFLRLTHPHLSQHDLLHGGRVDERGHPAHGHVQVHARRGRHQGEWEGRSKAHAEGARVCHVLYSLPIPLVTLTFQSLRQPASSCAALTARLLTFNWSCWRFSHQAWVGRRAGDRRRALHWTCHSRERPRWRGGAGRDSSHWCHHSHRQKLWSCSHCSRTNHNYLTLPVCSTQQRELQQSMCAERRLIWLVGWNRVVGSGRESPPASPEGLRTARTAVTKAEGAATPRRCCWAGKVRTVTWAQHQCSLPFGSAGGQPGPQA